MNDSWFKEMIEYILSPSSPAPFFLFYLICQKPFNPNSHDPENRESSIQLFSPPPPSTPSQTEQIAFGPSPSVSAVKIFILVLSFYLSTGSRSKLYCFACMLFRISFWFSQFARFSLLQIWMRELTNGYFSMQIKGGWKEVIVTELISRAVSL